MGPEERLERHAMQRERKAMESGTWGHKAGELSQMGQKRGLTRYEKVRASGTQGHKTGREARWRGGNYEQGKSRWG